MVRNNLVLAKTTMAQQLPSKWKTNCEISSECQYIIQNGDFPYGIIGNMDETPVYFDMVPSKTINQKGKKTIKVRSTKSDKQ